MSHDIFDLLASRATCRNFSSDPIAPETLEKLYTCACSAPSGGGFQNISIIEVTEPQTKEKLVQLSRNQRFIAQAPVDLIFCIDHRRTWRIAQHEYAPKEPVVPFWSFIMGVIDAALSAQTLCLAAEALGLRSCFNGNVIQQSDELCRILNIPQYVLPVFMLTLGYPRANSLPLSPKYPSRTLVHRESYQDQPIEQLYTDYCRKTSGQHFQLSENRLKKICQTAERLFGSEWAEQCAARIQEQGELSSLQYWLGCFYADSAGDMTYKSFQKLYRKHSFEL